MADDVDVVALFNAKIITHKKAVAVALRSVAATCDEFPELYGETGPIQALLTVKAVSNQLADQLDPPAAVEV